MSWVGDGMMESFTVLVVAHCTTDHLVCGVGDGWLWGLFQAKAAGAPPDGPAAPDVRPAHWVELSKHGDSWLMCRDGDFGAL